MTGPVVISAAPRRAGLPASAPLWVTAVVGLATALLGVASNGSVAASVAPVLLAAVLWAIWVAPLRTTLGVAMFLGLAADRPGDTEGLWASPLSTVGGLLFHNLDHVISLNVLKFSGVFALVGLLLVVRAHRCLIGRAEDTEGSLSLAAPMRWALGVALATVATLVAFGVMRGGDIEVAKVQTQAFLQLLGVAYLFGVSLRGTRDYRWLGTIVVVGACVKAAMALWVRMTLPSSYVTAGGIFTEMEYATNHGDSLLFVCAAAVLIGPLFHGPSRRQLWRFGLLMPLIIAAVVANDRRIAWVQLGLMVSAYVLLNPASRPSRRLARSLVLLSPLLAVYAAVGWFSPSRVFAPVGFVRGIVQAERTDGSLDRSTLFRDVENFNLVQTFLPNPLLGTGFGHPFVQEAEVDALTEFTDYQYLPHNSLLGLWAFTGLAGVCGLLGTLVVAALLAVRARAAATTPDQAVAAVAALGCVGAYLVHLWADIGFTEAPTIFLVGLAMAMAGQLAVATGEWPGRLRPRPAVAPVPVWGGAR